MPISGLLFTVEVSNGILVHILRDNTGFSLVFATRFEEKHGDKRW